MSAANIPNRVAFVNIKDGSIFFDCHPSEARKAIEAIKEMRAGKYISDEVQEILKSTEIALMNKEEFIPGVVKGHINPEFMENCFEKIEVLERGVTHIFMNSVSYLQLRRRHRDIMDIESKFGLLETGKMATLWGAKIIVRRGLSKKMIFASMGKSPFIFHNYDIKIVPVETMEDVNIVSTVDYAEL